MAGHSKWANIQHRKGAQDAKRGKLFTKLIREVSVAARLGGSDPTANSRLRLAMDKALSGNVPKDTIERAIKRASGDQSGENIEEVRYEGYGPGGVAVMVDCMTDNRNRTVADVRHAFTKFGGNLGTDGSVAYLFTKLGQISYPAGSDEDAVMEAALEAGADDIVNNEDGSIDVLTTAGMPSTALLVATVFVLAGFGFKISMVPFHNWTPDVYEGASTPVTAAARSDDQARSDASNSDQPRQRSARNRWSWASRRTSSAATPSARAPSVPGRGARCRSARSAVRVRIGSTTTSGAPSALAVSMKGHR